MRDPGSGICHSNDNVQGVSPTTGIGLKATAFQLMQKEKVWLDDLEQTES